MSSGSPFGCGPNPCQWRCGPVTVPPECTWCNDPVPSTMVARGTWTPAAVCTDCDSFPTDFALPFLSSGGVPNICEWGFLVAGDDAYIWPCAGDPSDVQVGILLDIFQSGPTVAISLEYQWQGAVAGSASYFLNTGQFPPIDCTGEYTLAFNTQSGIPFCTVPTEVVVNPST